MGVTRIESNRNRHFGLKIESKSIENRNLEIVTSLLATRLLKFKLEAISISSTVHVRWPDNVGG